MPFSVERAVVSGAGAEVDIRVLSRGSGIVGAPFRGNRARMMSCASLLLSAFCGENELVGRCPCVAGGVDVDGGVGVSGGGDCEGIDSIVWKAGAGALAGCERDWNTY